METIVQYPLHNLLRCISWWRAEKSPSRSFKLMMAFTITSEITPFNRLYSRFLCWRLGLFRCPFHWVCHCSIDKTQWLVVASYPPLMKLMRTAQSNKQTSVWWVVYYNLDSERQIHFVVQTDLRFRCIALIPYVHINKSSLRSNLLGNKYDSRVLLFCVTIFCSFKFHYSGIRITVIFWLQRRK
jgi:hypothetical protein